MIIFRLLTLRLYRQHEATNIHHREEWKRRDNNYGGSKIENVMEWKEWHLLICTKVSHFVPGLAFTLYVTVCVCITILYMPKRQTLFLVSGFAYKPFWERHSGRKLKFHTQILDINIYSAIGAIMQGQIWRSNKNR